jgi:hypothetical protein
MIGLEEFIRNGRTSYREAKQATNAFEQEVLGRLRSIVSQRSKWGPFDKGRMTTSLGGDESDGYYVGLCLKGQVGKEAVEIELGLWWLTSRHQFAAKEVVFASFAGGPARLRQFRPDSADLARCFAWDERTYLAEPMPEDMDPAPALNRLLDALVRVM